MDSSKDIARSLNYTLEVLNLPLKPEEEVRKFIGDGMKTLLQRATERPDDVFIGKAVEIFRPHYLKHCTDATILYPGTKEVLSFFRNKALALISNKPGEMVLKILDHFGIRNYFKVVLGGESTKEKKPHPEPVLRSLDLMQTAKDAALIVGDGTTDIQAGKSAGILTCAVTYGYKDPQELSSCQPDFLIDRIADLKKIISP